MIVADTNLIAYLVLPGDRTDEAEAVLLRDPDWAVPPLWRGEMRRILGQYVRRGALTIAQAVASIDRADTVVADREGDVDSRLALELAQRSKCSTCDCEYVALATSLGVALVTAAAAVLKAFPKIAVTPRAFSP